MGIADFFKGFGGRLARGAVATSPGGLLELAGLDKQRQAQQQAVHRSKLMQLATQGMTPQQGAQFQLQSPAGIDKSYGASYHPTKQERTLNAIERYFDDKRGPLYKAAYGAQMAGLPPTAAFLDEPSLVSLAKIQGGIQPSADKVLEAKTDMDKHRIPSGDVLSQQNGQNYRTEAELAQKAAQLEHEAWVREMNDATTRRGQDITAQSAQDRLHAPTPAMREYGHAVEQGFQGTFPDYQLALKQAGANNVNVSTHAETQLEKERGKGTANALNAMVNDGAEARNDLHAFDRLGDLLTDVDTGASAAIRHWLAQKGLTLPDGKAGRLQAVQALVDYMIPKMRVPGSGPSSDRDMESFKNSLPNLINTPEGNRMIMDTLRGMAQRRVQLGDIATQWQLGYLTPQQAYAAMEQARDPFAELEQLQAEEKHGTEVHYAQDSQGNYVMSTDGVNWSSVE